MINNDHVDALTVLLEVLGSLENNHKNVLQAILDEIDLSDKAYAGSVKDVESLLKESVF